MKRGINHSLAFAIFTGLVVAAMPALAKNPSGGGGMSQRSNFQSFSGSSFKQQMSSSNSMVSNGVKTIDSGKFTAKNQGQTNVSNLSSQKIHKDTQFKLDSNKDKCKDPCKNPCKDPCKDKKCGKWCGPCAWPWVGCYHGGCYDSGYCDDFCYPEVVEVVVIPVAVAQPVAVQTNAVQADVVRASAVQADAVEENAAQSGTVQQAAAAAPTEEGQALPKVKIGSTITVQGQSLGKEPGRIAMQVGELVLPVKLVKWEDSSAQVTLPQIGLASSAKAKLIVARADGSKASEVAFELVAAEQAAQN